MWYKDIWWHRSNRFGTHMHSTRAFRSVLRFVDQLYIQVSISKAVQPELAHLVSDPPKGRIIKRNYGFSLLEVTFAVALLAVILASSAYFLGNAYVAVDLQRQRVEALNACRAVISLVREKREQYASDFPVSFLSWIASQEEAGWTNFLKNQAGPSYLPNHAIHVTCRDLDGNAAENNDNPIRIHVRSEWQDPRGRPMQVEVVTILTNE